MIDLDVVKGDQRRHELQKRTPAFVILIVNIVGNQVIDTDAAAIGGTSAAFFLGSVFGRDGQNSRDIANPVVAQRDVIHTAFRAMARLAGRREENGESGLRETSPGIFQQVAFNQKTHPAFEFQIVFGSVGFAFGAGRISGIAFFPDHGTKQMVVADFHVGRVILRPPPPNRMSSPEASRKLL